MEQLSELFKVLSDSTRLRILILLYQQDLCVCELTEIMNESQPKISKHIAKIRSNNLVTTIRNEQYIYYSLNRNHLVLMNQLRSLLPGINQTEPFQSDLQRLSTIESFVCTR